MSHLQRTINLIGRDVVEALALISLRKTLPVNLGSLEQRQSTHHVGMSESEWILDTSIYMTLGSEMDDAIHLVVLHQFQHQVEIADVALYESIVRLVLNILEVSQITSVSQLVEVDDEQDTLEISMENAKAEIEKYESDTVRADKFIELVKRYTDFSELTTPMLNEFVEKILVHEADYSSGERVQEVEIYLNFIGKFELPVKEATAEEIAEHEKLKARRAKKAEYNRRYMEKRRKRIAEEEQKSKEVTVNS